VRSYPGSRRCPWFNREALGGALPADGIAYEHAPALGGRRQPRLDSANTTWRHPSFRGYADYMEGPAFVAALALLLARASSERCAIMCSEAVPWRCHRQMIADALLAAGAAVLDIIGAGDPRPHALSAHARVVAGRVDYTAGQLALPGLK
jgi:uncharacterized protein (DUF488 family)